MMQAFIYHHLVPTEEVMLANIDSRLELPPATCRIKDELKLKPGQTATVIFDAPISFLREQLNLKVESQSIAAGMSIVDVAFRRGTIQIELATDARTENDLEGNLIFELISERVIPATESRQARTFRIPAGHLPAVPFKIM
jgi:hypothetical protein